VPGPHRASRRRAPSSSGALGIAVLGSIGAAVYRGSLAAALPGSVPAGATRAAGDTLGGAVAAAGRLDAAGGAALRAAAHDAFIAGARIAAFVSAIVVVVFTALAAWLLRGSTAPASGEGAGGSVIEPEGIQTGRRP
jgi:MFS transporter, DHA2 family, multidrug resistance protein